MSLEQINILLIEDDPEDADLLQEILFEKNLGSFRVQWVDKLQIGLEQLGQGFGVVLLDLSLPDSQDLETFKQVAQAVQMCAPEPEWAAEMVNNPLAYEEPSRSTQVSLDDVNVKRQKSSRQENPEPQKKRKYTHNTVAHIAHADGVYLINGIGIVRVLRLVLAFLPHILSEHQMSALGVHRSGIAQSVPLLPFETR